MTEVLFYHLTESKLEDALPPLLEKSVERGWRVAVQLKEGSRRELLDQPRDRLVDRGLRDHVEVVQHQGRLISLAGEGEHHRTGEERDQVGAAG